MANRAQREHYGVSLEGCEFRFQVTIASLNLNWQRLVLGWYALHGVRETAVDQLETVIPSNRFGLVRKSVAIQRSIEKYARMITGKRPAARVRTVEPRRKSYE